MIDAGSGKNKVWFRNIPTKRKDEFELSEDKDFLAFNGKADWIIGNPPFRDYIKFCYKSCEVADKGFAFMVNHARLNQLTTKRLSDFATKGFFLSGIHIFDVKKWFGRYYFVIFTKERNDGITWSRGIED